MNIEKDDIGQFIIEKLRLGQNSGSLHQTDLHQANYDIFLNNVVVRFMAENNIPDPNQQAVG